MFLEAYYLILGFIFLILGANLLVKGASNIAKIFQIPEILIGLTIVALGTSAPELIVTITSASKGKGDLIIGNAVGSNLCNLLLVLGIMAIIKPIQINKQAKNIHIPISLLVTVLVVLMGISLTIDKIEAIILLILFIIYFFYPVLIKIKEIKNNVESSSAHAQEKSKMSLSTIFILVGIILLKFGGDFVVDNSINIARILNISEEIIGLTIIAFGTSLPELATSIIAVIREGENLAVGNIVGSCILNLLLILGVGAIIIPLNISTKIFRNIIILMTSVFLIWVLNFIGKKNYITRVKGMGLLVIFTLYIANLI